MLGANAGVVESRGDRVRRGYLAVGVLQQVTQASVKHPWRACAQRGAMMTGGDALSRSLDSDQPDLTIVEEAAEDADGVGATPDTGNHRMRQPGIALEYLLASLSPDHRLEVAH